MTPVTVERDDTFSEAFQVVFGNVTAITSRTDADLDPPSASTLEPA